MSIKMSNKKYNELMEKKNQASVRLKKLDEEIKL